MARALGACLLVLASVSAAAAQPAVFLVRHAERADAGGAGAGMMADDPDLSQAGMARAASLATLLKDAKISAIYTSKYKRTRQTALPLAGVLGLEPIFFPAVDPAGLVRRIGSDTGNVLVVGHSNTIPELIKSLGVEEAVTIGEQEYDNLFVVVRAAAPVLLRLRY